MFAKRFSNLFRHTVSFRISVMVVAAFALLSSQHVVQGAQIAWRKDFAGAAREAQRLRKPLLVVVGARWCGYCQQMQQQTFPNAAVSQRVNGQFIPVLIDADEQPAVVEQLNVSALPTVLVMSPERKVLNRSSGFQSATDLNTQLAAFQPVAQTRQFQPTQTSFWRAHAVQSAARHVGS